MKNFFRLPLIIGSLPVTLTNGTTADATQVMSDLNWIVNQVNANAAPLANTALTNANNNFTVVQSGLAATAAAHFPIAQQVQNEVFNTLSSTLGTNVLTARVAALPLGAYAVGQVFTFTPSQRNTASVTINIDSLGSGVIKSSGQLLVGGELGSGASMVRVSSAGAMPVLDLIGNFPSFFESGEIAIGAQGTTTTSAHGLGVIPRDYLVILRCKVSEAGYAVGDEIHLVPSQDPNSLYADSTNIGIVRATPSTLQVINRGTFAFFGLTDANWRYVVRAWK